ncbi:hypothetical protein AYO38_11270 [bacterium SCGC AG-212-C10]|nr:hypothetical protein AYO38_11270 [bacterium SCGC AG-212-C10]
MFAERGRAILSDAMGTTVKLLSSLVLMFAAFGVVDGLTAAQVAAEAPAPSTVRPLAGDCPSFASLDHAQYILRVIAALPVDPEGCDTDADSSGGPPTANDVLFVLRFAAGLPPIQ